MRAWRRLKIQMTFTVFFFYHHHFHFVANFQTWRITKFVERN